VVKLIGDEAMFVVQGPAAACRLALALVDGSPHPLRVGMAHGAVVALHGDYYGPTVNLAARLVAVAPTSEVLVSDAVRQSVSLDDVTFQPFTTGPLRGFPDVTTGYRLGGLGRATHV